MGYIIDNFRIYNAWAADGIVVVESIVSISTYPHECTVRFIAEQYCHAWK